jgi:diguanylate cyclase (GGDEF)-like protein
MSSIALPTVLIVDDDRVNRTILAELLRDECRVLLARDGVSALRKASEETDLDLILLDVSMPGMDGYEVLRRLRAEKQTSNTAVIFITALTDEEDEERGLSLGVLDYVFKPIRPVIVHARIRNVLRLVAQRKELEILAARDSLTGLANRRHFDQSFNMACRRAARTGEPLSLAMIDVDYFKQYNDRYGHGAGDDALREVAEVIAGIARRPFDVAARYGGEEFMLLLPGTRELHALLEQLRHEVLSLALAHEDSQIAEVLTVSCGGVITEASREHVPSSPAELLREADRLLYLAKRQGRNRVVVQRDAGPIS